MSTRTFLSKSVAAASRRSRRSPRPPSHKRLIAISQTVLRYRASEKGLASFASLARKGERRKYRIPDTEGEKNASPRDEKGWCRSGGKGGRPGYNLFIPFDRDPFSYRTHVGGWRYKCNLIGSDHGPTQLLDYDVIEFQLRTFIANVIILY